MEDFFRELELERTQPLVARDMPALERLHALEYELVTPPGNVFSRERYLGSIAAEPFYASWDCGPIRVRVSPRMALVRYEVRIGFPSGRIVEVRHMDATSCATANGRPCGPRPRPLPPKAAP